MPIKKSAKKSLRQAKKRAVQNLLRKRAIKDLIKKILKAAALGDTNKVKELLPLAQKAIDKAAKTKAIKKNAANRKKSRLAVRLKKMVIDSNK